MGSVVDQDSRSEEKVILSMFHGMWQNRCLGVVVGLNIPEILCNAEQPSISIDDLAKQTGCASSEQLYPVMRVLAQWGIGIELPNKQFTKNRAMELLRKDRGPSLGSMVAYFNSDENWAAMLALPEAVKTGQPAFKVEHGMVHFDYMSRRDTHLYDPAKIRPGCSKHPIGSAERREEYLQIYNQAMIHLTHLAYHDKAFASRSIFDVFPWSECTRLMDLAGGTGSFLASILQQPGCKHVQGILTELPAVIEDAKKDPAIQDNHITLLPHDCFHPFPSDVPKVDTIMSKNFVTMINSEQFSLVLQNCRSLFPEKGGRFLVVCSNIPAEPGDTKNLIAANQLQPGFLNIIHTSSTHSSYPRTCKSEWIQFLQTAARKAGYKLANVHETSFGGATIFELIPILL